MNRMSTCRVKLDRWHHNIMHMPKKRLDKEVFMSGHWTPIWSIGDEFQVTHSYNGQQFIVNVANKTCACGFWELVGIPCRHAVAALGYRHKTLSNLLMNVTQENHMHCAMTML